METYDKCYNAVLKILQHDPHNWCEYEFRCKTAVRKISNGSVNASEVITDVLQLFGIDY